MYGLYLHGRLRPLSFWLQPGHGGYAGGLRQRGVWIHATPVYQ